MTKAVLFATFAVFEIVVAVLAYRSGRLIIPILLVVAAICFFMVAIGHARGLAKPKSER